MMANGFFANNPDFEHHVTPQKYVQNYSALHKINRKESGEGERGNKFFTEAGALQFVPLLSFANFT